MGFNSGFKGLNTGSRLGCIRFKILFVEMDIKAANCKQESYSLIHFHIQFDSGNKYLTFNFKFDNFVLCNK